MRCYYEELGVQRDSNETDIKSAYRKLALRWHPDKNPDCLDEAKARFQLIQQAYEVLSNAQERAWYDNHREQILRGKNSEYEENSLDVFQYFSGSCYKGYGDDDNGFYSVYRSVFQKIATEDIEFVDSEEYILNVPDFGNANSSYDDIVAPFYAYWQAYSTKKTYEWLCPFNMFEVKERFILRQMEKDMKKIVQKARKERNEEVRNLVSFVRNRDRRVQAHRRVLEARVEANRLKQEEKRKEQLRKRQQDLAAARNNTVDNDNYEEQLKQLELQYGSDSSAYTDDDETDEAGDSENNLEADEIESELEYVDELYCVACNKSFRNAKARANHEESKKHRENVERLRLEMAAEEKTFNDCNEVDDGDNIIAEQLLRNLQLNGNNMEDMSACSDDDVEVSSAESRSANKRGKKSKKTKKPAVRPVEHENDTDEVAEHDFEVHSITTMHNDSDDDWGKGKKSVKRSKNKKTTNTQKGEAEVKSLSATDATVSEAMDQQKLSPAAAATTRAKNFTPTDAQSQHICVTCKAAFDSKNKLFAHLKKTNHGVYIAKAKPDVEGKPPKSKGKRK